MTQKNFLIIFLISSVILAAAIFLYLGEKREGLSPLDFKSIPDTPVEPGINKIAQETIF